jgi:hypothetical protein
MSLTAEAKHEIDQYLRGYLKELAETQHKSKMVFATFSATVIGLLIILCGLGGWALRITAIDAAKTAVETNPIASEVAKVHLAALKAGQEAKTESIRAKDESDKLLNTLGQIQREANEATNKILRAESSATEAVNSVIEAGQKAKNESERAYQIASNAATSAESAQEELKKIKSNILDADNTLKAITSYSEELTTGLINNENFQKIISEKIYKIPSGAVLAFDLPGGCPEGWSSFQDASGRSIIGEGKGVGLSKRNYRAAGGEEKHTLTISEIPQHDHGGIYGGNGGKAGMTNDFAYHSSGFQKINPEGGGQPHNNMPPFIVLHFCRKD